MGFIVRRGKVVALGILTALGLACAWPAHAARHAMIVSVRAGDQQQSDKNKDYCRQTRALFEAAGFDHISLFFEGGPSALKGSEDATDSAILAQLKEEAETLGKSDEFWFVLYGYASNSSRGVSLATKGKRLSGQKLADALDAIEAPQCILALNQGSAPLMPLLCTRSDRRVLTAASSNGQLNPPLLPEQLFKIWSTNLTADCRTVFSEAAEQTEATYTSQSLAIAEVSQLFDGTDIDVFPFEMKPDTTNAWSLAGSLALAGSERAAVAVDTSTRPETTKPSRLGKIDFSEFEDMLSDSERAKVQPATEETLKLIEEAKKQAPEYAGYPAFMPQYEKRFVVNLDESTRSEAHSQIYLLNSIAAENYGHILMEDYPPQRLIEFKTARVIYPDGRFLELERTSVNNLDRGVRHHNLKVPGAHAGCLIELSLVETGAADSTLPIINEELALQKTIPIASARITLESPKQRDVRCKLYNTMATPTESTGEYSLQRVYELGALPAMEPLPYDPPWNDFAMRLVVSSLESWDAFREWTDKIMVGSDAVDKATKAKAAELTANAKSDADKVKAIYEFLCDLRYETTPIGARAFRPRLPGEVCTSLYGDCKDKANALVAMARSVGVTGYMCLVNRTSTTDESFPSWQFNHAVAYFPELDGYTNGLWCDATDGSTPFASLPPGDIGRDALVLKDNETVFETIQLPNPEVNTLEQTWDLAVDPAGSVKGSIRYEAHGLSDYYLRQSLKRSSPLQTKYLVQSMVSGQATGLSVEKVDISDLSNLSAPLSITAQCTGTDWTLVRDNLAAPYDLWNAVGVAQRDRALLINDGQPLKILQTIKVKGDSKIPSELQWDKQTDLANMEVNYTAVDGGWERRTMLDLNQPRVSPEAYAQFQAQVSEWNTALRHHLSDKGQGTK